MWFNFSLLEQCYTPIGFKICIFDNNTAASRGMGHVTISSSHDYSYNVLNSVTPLYKEVKQGLKSMTHELQILYLLFGRGLLLSFFVESCQQSVVVSL